MPSRQLPPPPNPASFDRGKVLFLALIVSSTIVILLAVLYLLYHLYYSLLNRTRTIPFDSATPLKLQRFSYKDLKSATSNFNDANILGKGGSGTVFKGTLRDGKSIAVKRLDSMSLETEREFQNELQILGGLRSPFLVTLLGYCVEKNKRILVYEYMPNRSLQESLFGEGMPGLSWDRRFAIILDVARALEFLHLGCDPPVIHGDVKPSNVLLDFDFRAKVADFGLSRMKVEGEFEFGVDLFSQELGRSQELWKSQELSGALASETPVISTPVERVDSPHEEVDFALALQASSSSKMSWTSYNAKALNLGSAAYNVNIASECDLGGVNGKGKEVSVVDIRCDDWNSKFVPYSNELFGFNRANDVNLNTCSGASDVSGGIQWGKDWWWRQDGSGELCSKDYVREWIGSQICPSTNPDWDDEDKKSIPDKAEPCISTQLDRAHDMGELHVRHPSLELDKNDDLGDDNNSTKRHRKMQDWWKEERVAETRTKNDRKGTAKLRILRVKWKKGFKLPHFDIGRRLYFRKRKKFGDQTVDDLEADGEFSFRRGWKKKCGRSNGSDMWSGDLFSRELSSTTSMRGTLCYVAPEYGGCGYLMEKADVYSFGVLILVIVSGRRPLHVLASPMKLEKANLISWCRQLAQAGDILELVDEKLKGEYNKEQTTLCINLALICLQKMPELRPDIGEIVKILKGEMDLPPIPFEFSPSPPTKVFGKSRRKEKKSTERASPPAGLPDLAQN